MRRHLRRLIVATLLLALVIGGGLVARNLWRQRNIELALEVLDLLPEVAQRIQDFHRVKVENGRKVWEVSAKEAQYFGDEEVVAVRKPVVAVYPEDGRTIGMSGHEGRVILSGTDVKRVEVEGTIDVQVGEYSVRTESAHYEADTDRITAPGAVRVEGGQLEFDGDRMEIDLRDHRLRVKGNVRMVLWPDGVGG